MSCKQLLLNFHNTKKIFQNKFVNNLRPFQRHLSATVLSKNIIEIRQDNDETLKFPGVWLRDNCQCSECFHTQTKSREINWERFNPNIHVKSTSAPSKNSISIEWNDSHISTFHLDWLKERDFSDNNRLRYIEEAYKPAAQLWSKDQFKDVTRKFEYNDVLNDDNAFLAWLEALAIQGFAIIENVPQDSNVARLLAEKIGYIKKTTYGEEFAVKTKFDTNNYAYLMTPLPLHSDMVYFEYMPGINILHFFVQSNSAGGANLMTDAFYIANKMQKYFPEYYDILTRVPVDWYDIGKDSGISFHNIWRSPVICLDADGRLHRINHNTPKRDSHFTVPLDIVTLWYEAYDKFLELINAEAVEFKVDTGNVFAFNNLRMLHGRTAFNDSQGNQRHLIGAYVDWDIIYSKMRMLRAQK